MKGLDDIAAPDRKNSLIDHTLSREHEAHSAEPAGSQPDAQKMEVIRGEGPGAQMRLARRGVILTGEKEEHMAKEECIRLPPLRTDGVPDTGFPISIMRTDDDLTTQILPENGVPFSCRKPKA
ncbi:MAG: hypothetical protein EP337_05865 [Rhodobacteraceae bacterium]|nr:MAG: hypothetical protein EP337_05865 [Paracoccaceae bacterium]